MSQQVPMYNPREILFRKTLPIKDVKFKPVEDGFVTTSGNAELGAKWGNLPTVLKPVQGPFRSNTETILHAQREGPPKK